MGNGGWWYGLLAMLATAAPGIVLDAGDSAANWSGGVTVIDDAKVGDHAVRYEVPPGRAAGPALRFGHLGIVPSADQELVFWYRFNGTGACSLMIKIVAYPFADGWQATWPILSKTAVPQGWQRAVIDLSSEWLQWGEQPDRTSRMIMFRTEGADGTALTLDLDQVELRPRQMSWSVGAPRLEGETFDVPVSLTNPTGAALSYELAAGGPAQTITIRGGETAELALAGVADPAWLRDAEPLSRTEVRVSAQVAGDAETRREQTVSLIHPLTLPDHPRLLVSAAELPALRERIAQVPWAQTAWSAIQKNADSQLDQPVELPDRGSQWWHYYACQDDGTRLKTLSPTQHQCPTCQRIYSGWPWDDVVLDRIHNRYANALRDLGFAWQITGDEKYLPPATAILMAYADRYESYPLHNTKGEPKTGGGRVGPQTLDESTWLIPMAQGADLIWDRLTDAQREHAETGLFRPAAELIRNHRMGIHNIQCWKNSAVGLVGLLLNDAELTADAVTSDHGFKAQIAEGINADGQWYEGAWGYHFYTVSALLPLAEAGERCGLGLYAYTHDGRQYRSLFDGPLNLAMPDLVLPAFNDSGATGLKGRTDYEVALGRYGNPAWAALVNPQRTGGLLTLINGVEPLPDHTTAKGPQGGNYLSAGYGILQHGEGAGATWACLKYGPHGGGHGHPDKLNLILWHRGQQLTIDPGTTAYGVPLQRDWFRTTIAHNTLTIDESDQRPATGQSLAWATGPDLSVMMAAAGPIAPGIDYRRAVALCGQQLVLVLDDVVAEAAHTFDFAWHNAGTWTTPPAGAPAPLPDKPGYRHLRDMVTVRGGLPPIAVSDKITVGLAVTGGTVTAGYGFGRRANDQVTATLCRVQGATARVGWALGLDGTAPKLTIDGDSLVATLAGQTWRLTLTGDPAAPVVVSGPGGELRGTLGK